MPFLTPPSQRAIVIIGKESTGKSQLIASLTDRSPYSTNFRGSTVTCEIYVGDGATFVDTPGILYRSDTATTRVALEQLQTHDTVLLVAKATHVDEDLRDLLPLVAGKQGIVVITFWDKVLPSTFTQQTVHRWEQASNLAFIPVDARHLTAAQQHEILAAMHEPSVFPSQWHPIPARWHIEPRPTLLEHPQIGWLWAISLLLLPAILAVWSANSFATSAEPLVQGLVKPTVEGLSSLPSLVREILIGRYGLVTMGPLLLVWAVPTVILYALFLGAYKASGLVERITVALHPLLHPFGLSGRDLVRIIMGFGCNVPAVISTRACSSCSRKTCISAIAFGSACSYQLGATLGVFSAARLPYFIIPYLSYLTLTTLIYTRLLAPKSTRSLQNTLVIEHRTFRKDGLLLFAEPNMVSLLSPLQILTGVYLAGVLLPCLVTALTIAHEQSLKLALGLMARQVVAAILFSMILAWGGRLFLIIGSSLNHNESLVEFVSTNPEEAIASFIF